jgi:phosphorylase kinase alpha/beta subunit
MNQLLRQQESLRIKHQESNIDWVVPPTLEESLPAGGWKLSRQRDGAINRVPKNFFKHVWQLMQHCKGLVIGDKLERRNRLDSDLILAEMTSGEKNFALRVEHLLNKIEAPEYRQVNVETLLQLDTLTSANPSLQIEEYIVLDVLIGHAVRLAWLERCPEADRYDEYKSAAWRSFYNTSPGECASYVVKAFRFLSEFSSEGAGSREWGVGGMSPFA